MEYDYAVVSGVLAPSEFGRPSFVTPIFRSSDGVPLIQQTEHEKVFGFDVLQRSENARLIDSTTLLSSQHVAKGSDQLYGFSFGSNEVLVGSRRDLSRILFARVDEFNDNPLLKLDVAEFIGDAGQMLTSLKAASAELSTLDFGVACEFFSSQNPGRAHTQDTDLEKLSKLTLSLIKFSRSYSRLLYVGSDHRRNVHRARYQRAFDKLLPLVFDVEVSSLFDKTIENLSHEKSQGTFHFQPKDFEVPERHLKALTKVGISRTAAERVLNNAITGLPDASGNTSMYLEMAKRGLFKADASLITHAHVSRALEKAEKKIRKRALRVGVVSIAYGVILIIRSVNRADTASLGSDADLQSLGLSAILAGLRDLAPTEPLMRDRASADALGLRVGSNTSSVLAWERNAYL